MALSLPAYRAGCRKDSHLYKDNLMTNSWNETLPQSVWANFKEISISDDWFKAYQITDNLFVFHEPRHYEETLVNLIIGREKAALIDTGCGIGDLRKAVKAMTNKPIVVINTHTHTDHIGSNSQFDEVAMFDHSLSHRVAENGVSHQTMQNDILAENLVIKPWPQGFDPNGFSLPPFRVHRWLRPGDRIDLGDRDLFVIPTPGEAADHICLLDRTDRILFCGDILLRGSVWTHLEGGNLNDLVMSYKRLMGYFDDFDYLMPSHNEPWLGKELLPASLAGAEKVLAGEAEYREITDPWNRRLRQYSFDQFSILTPQ
jgi:glyoxylase-like metal-dependent hydrolase (beta-lactamase superfamily II)